jgi:hypothetical protein
MNLAQTYFNSYTGNVQTEGEARTQSRSGRGFQSVMEMAERSDGAQQRHGVGAAGGERTQNQHQLQNQAQAQTQAQPRQQSPQDRADMQGAERVDRQDISGSPKFVDDVEDDDIAETKNKPRQTVIPEKPKTVAVLKSEDELKAVNAIAAVFGVTSEEVAAILASMGISAAELAEPGVLTEFIREMYGVQMPADLLGITNITDVFRKMRDITANIGTQTPQSENAAAMTALMTETEETAEVINLTGIINANADESKVIADRETLNTTDTYQAQTRQTADNAVNIQQNAQAQANAVSQAARTIAQAAAVNVEGEEPAGIMVADVETETGLLVPVNSGQTALTPGGSGGGYIPAGEGAATYINAVPVTETDQNAVIGLNTGMGTGTTAAAATPNNAQANEAQTQRSVLTETENVNILRPDFVINQGLFTDARAQAATESAMLRTPQNVSTQDVLNQIVEQMKVNVRVDNSTEIRITLRPESLGEVTLRLVTQNGIVTARIQFQPAPRCHAGTGFTDFRFNRIGAAG